MREENPSAVASEATIIWVRGGPDDYPYLREHRILSSYRRAKPAHQTNLVAYATLRRCAESIYPHRFDRRVWTFRATDPYPCACPMEAVKPHSIAAGRLSESGRE